MATLASVCEDDFSGRTRLLDALKAVNITTVKQLLDYRLKQLTKDPPDLATAEHLLDLCKTKDASIKKDEEPWLTALGIVIENAKNSKGDSGNKDKVADQWGEQKYNSLRQVMCANVAPAERVEGRLVKKASEELDRGTLTPDTYTLPKLRGALTTEETEEFEFGGVNMHARKKADEPTSRNGEVLHQIWRFVMMILAAGARIATPTNSVAASKGGYGTFATATAGVTVRWHATPDGAFAYFLSALEASSTLSPSALQAAHIALHRKIVTLLQQGYNWETAVHKTLDSKSFLTVETAGVTIEGGGKKTPQDRGNGSKSPKRQREKDLERENQKLRAQLGGGGGSADGGKKTKPICWNYQSDGCTMNDKCKFDHRCGICSTSGHPASECPKVNK